MKFSEMVDQAVEFLRRRERVSYRALQREFDLDDASLADLKDELIKAAQVARDGNGEVLVWVGNAEEDKGKWIKGETAKAVQSPEFRVRTSPGSKVQGPKSRLQTPNFPL